MSADVNAADIEESPNKERSIDYWIKWIAAAKKAAKRHWDDARAAYDEYELPESTNDDRNKPKRGYNIYAESSWTLEPALYSQAPKIIGKRKFGIEDEVALTMSLIVERLGQHLVDEGNFNDGMFGARGDFMHASKATTQVIYERDTEDYRKPLTQDSLDQNIYYGPEGKPHDGEVLSEGESYFANEKRVIESTQKIYLAPVLFDEILHTPHAKTESEITEKAYKFCIPYDEAEKKFNTGPDGKSLGRSLPYSTAKDYQSKNGDDEDNTNPGRQLEGWECYCLKTKHVYWVCEAFKSDFLTKPQLDPDGLKGFFPSPPFIIRNKRRKSLYPTPTFVYLEATANLLHKANERVFKLWDAVRPRALVYGASQEVIDALNRLDDLQFIRVSDIDDILQKGGLKGMMEWVPVQELVQAIAEAINLEEHFKNRFNEGFGLPDILRGVSDPAQTATAQEIQSDAGHDRFKGDKKQIIDLARNSAEMMLDLALKVYSPEKIAKICGHEYMERGTPEVPAQPPSEQNPQGVPAVPAKPSHYELFYPALQRLQNDEDRLVTIDFETDSTNFRDEQKDIRKAQMISETVANGLGGIGNAQNPEFVPIALDLLLSTLDAMGGSTKSENMIKKAVAELEKIRNAPKPPPPPDPQEIKNQIAMQQQKIDAANTARELSQKDYELKLEANQQAIDQRIEEIKASLGQQVEGMRIALQNKEAEIANAKRIDQAQEAQAKVITKERELDVKAEMLQRDTELSAIKIESERQANSLYAALEARRIENDSLRVKQEEVLSKLRVLESFMEEMRLSKESRVSNAATLIDSISAANAQTEVPTA